MMLQYTAEPPSKKALKEHFIDANRERFSQDTLNCVAHLILSIEIPEEVMKIGLDFLVAKFSASRANGGFMTPKDKLYQPVAIRCREPQSPADFGGVTFSNTLKVFQQAWKHNAPVACEDIPNSPLLGDSRDKFMAISSRSILMQRLTVSGEPVGMACIDFTNEPHAWSSEEISFMASFCDTFLGPLVGISRYWHSPRKFQPAKKPSKSELEAIRLAASGMSYKQIARELGKSVRTIENQLKSARCAVGASNQVELIRKCQMWL